MSTGMLAGCYRRAVKIPGVFDMRTDGAKERLATPGATGRERDGFEGLVQGKGAVVVGNTILIEDRAYWVLGAIPAVQRDLVAEFDAAVKAAPGGLRDVYVGEQFMFVDWGISFVARAIFPPAAWVTPSFTAVVTGTPLRDERRKEPRATTPSPPQRAPPESGPPENAPPESGPPENAPPPVEPVVPSETPAASETAPVPATPSDGLAPPDELSPDEDLFGEPLE